MLESFPEFLDKAAGKKLALFLDYDGTRETTLFCWHIL